MSDVPEYSYRSKDVLYEVYLPSWATRRESVSLRLTNGDDEQDKIKVKVRDLDTEPTVEFLENSAVEKQSYLDDQTPSLWTGEVDERTAVRRTTSGSFSWSRSHENEPFVDDSLFVGFTHRDGGRRVGLVSVTAEGGSPAAERDILSVVKPICKMPHAVPERSAAYQVRGFGVLVQDSWKCAFRGVGETHDYGPPRPSHWGDDEETPGYKVHWGITGILDDLEADIGYSKESCGVPPDGHGLNAPPPPLSPKGLKIADYMQVDMPAVEHDEVVTRDMHGKEVWVKNAADKYAQRIIAAWFDLGGNTGFEISIRVEAEVLERGTPLWSELVSSVRVERA